MQILLTGATGLVGKELGKKLVLEGHTLVITTRNKSKAIGELPFPAKIIEWPDYHKEFPREALHGVEGVINLAGESIASGRWNHKRKEEIYNSRILGTRQLALAIIEHNKKNPSKIKHFISASAIGIYGNRGGEILSEDSSIREDFLARVCQDWEHEANELTKHNVRVVTPRIGIVLSRHGGALLKMLPVFNFGIGGALGSGKQWMSWIDLHDLVEIFSFCLSHETLAGAVNAVAPQPETNLSFSQTLAASLSKKLFFPVPSLVLKIMLGEMSTLLLGSQRVAPTKLLRENFKFNFRQLSQSLETISHPLKYGQKELYAEQWVPKKPEEVFTFFSDETNLEKLTPPFLNFKILGKSTDTIEQGTIIDYQLKLYGIPLKWKTLIENWQVNRSFVDQQMKGPYQKWHHTHEFIPFAGGTLLKDKVHYKIPFGTLGDIFGGMKIKNDVTTIFSFRRKMITQLFYPHV